MHRGDRRLQRVARRRPGAQRLAHEPHALRDGPAVPPCPVLLRQQQQPAVLAGPGGAAGVGEEQQRQQAGHRGVAGQQRPQHPAQLQGALDQVGAHQVLPRGCRVAGREQQVHHREHGVDPRGQLPRGWHAVRDPGDGDLLLGARDPGGHGGLADEEGAGHLGGGQPAHQPQRQGDLRRAVQRRVAAGDHQPQPVVGVAVRAVVARVGGHRLRHQQRQVAALDAGVAQHVERASPGDGGEPGAGAGRHAAVAPLGQGRGEGLLHALLGDVDVAGDAHRRGEHEGPLATVRVGDRGGDGCGVGHALSRTSSPGAPRPRRSVRAPSGRRPGRCRGRGRRRRSSRRGPPWSRRRGRR